MTKVNFEGSSNIGVWTVSQLSNFINIITENKKFKKLQL